MKHPSKPCPLTLVLGGARSGKSRHAEALISALPAPWAYVATAQALDDEMRARIAAHRVRRGAGWETVEAPLDLPGALAASGARPVLVDCLTLWLTNVMLGGHDVAAAVAALEAALEARQAATVMVANEVGLGIVPENALARAFRDEAGRLNQRMAALAGRVVLLVAGIAVDVKERPGLCPGPIKGRGPLETHPGVHSVHPGDSAGDIGAGPDAGLGPQAPAEVQEAEPPAGFQGRSGRRFHQAAGPMEWPRRERPWPSDEERHREKMARRKAVQDAEVASKKIEKGLLIVHTGPGKGKSTAAFGLTLRMIGHGRAAAVVQFIKGAWSTGERAALERLGGDLLEWHTMGEGFTWETQDRARDIAAARRAWDKATELMHRPGLTLLVLDELNVALRYDHLPEAEVLAALASRPPGLHVVVTGRNARPALIEAADLVTEMTAVKHHFAAGVKAQPGIEF